MRVVDSVENIYECIDLRTGKVSKFDVSMLRPFVSSDVVVARMDEDGYLVRSIKSHHLGGTKPKNRTHYSFLIEFVDGSEEWLPYLDVRDLAAFEVYLRSQVGEVVEASRSSLVGECVASLTIGISSLLTSHK